VRGKWPNSVKFPKNKNKSPDFYHSFKEVAIT
jgi:hypothetical protein